MPSITVHAIAKDIRYKNTWCFHCGECGHLQRNCKFNVPYTPRRELGSSDSAIMVMLCRYFQGIGAAVEMENIGLWIANPSETYKVISCH